MVITSVLHEDPPCLVVGGLRGVNVNYRSRAVAKGLKRTIFCGMLF